MMREFVWVFSVARHPRFCGEGAGGSVARPSGGRWFPLLLPGVVRTALRLYNFIREDLVRQQLRGPRYRWHLLVLNGFKAHSGLAKIPLFNTRRS
jgi:hypothetical protein